MERMERVTFCAGRSGLALARRGEAQVGALLGRLLPIPMVAMPALPGEMSTGLWFPATFAVMALVAGALVLTCAEGGAMFRPPDARK